jgi:hypothetical protein
LEIHNCSTCFKLNAFRNGKRKITLVARQTGVETPHCSENLPKGVAWGVQIGMNGFEVAFRSRERTSFEPYVR